MLDFHKYLKGLCKRKPIIYFIITGNAKIVDTRPIIRYSEYDKTILKSWNIKE